MSGHHPILLAISGQTKPYQARRYYKSPIRGMHSIGEVEFESIDEYTCGELEKFRLGVYPAVLPSDHVPEGSS